METAVFRPRATGLARHLVLGAGGGLVLGLGAGMPPLLAALLGAVAAFLAVAIRQVTGVRLVARPEGVAVLGRDEPLDARWSELRIGFGASPRGLGLPAQRYCVLADARGRSFAFADLAGGPPCAPIRGLDGDQVEVVDLRDAALLLALVVQRAPAWYVLPPGLQAPPLAAQAPGDPEPAPAPARAAAPRARLGLLGLVGKVGSTAVKALKTTNVGWAAASAGAYTLVFSWQFAVALLLQLFVHEYGHVHAMRRTGMKVRGMYFIPFLGAVAVSEDAFTSRRQQVYVALSGPIWGSLFALVPAGLWLLTGNPAFAVVTAWWALINLFNLLPIAPLDGGRVMQALAFSFSSSLGVALTVLGLGGAVVAGTALGYELVWLIALLGALEFLGESQARAGGRALRLLPERARFGAEHFRYLRAVIGPPLGAPSEPFFLRELERGELAARTAPLGKREVLGWGLGYAALAAALLALVHFMSHVPGADLAARFLS